MTEYTKAAELKPCPFCGKPALDSPPGKLEIYGAELKQESAWHNSPGCLLHGLMVSENEMLLGWARRWNQRATALLKPKPLVREGE